MIVPSKGSRETWRARAKIAVFLLWVIIIFTQISLNFAAQEEYSSRFIRAPPPRNDPFSETPLFHAPSSNPAQVVASTNGGQDTLYGDEKRIIHTGPNPLHN
ncbi:CLAVATA3/ESR (CLE)-related protein 17 [Morella rubra]|uniref:CLAVATA3/ESR (CLE)-related protein 17 n=1 Tax=Morella rubra TaxID=262757 RepID=A0A6A1UZC2_9ROSI|nr:CLAVATA3/ESR (CLE)-related protein 17 [Morella rubra]